MKRLWGIVAVALLAGDARAGGVNAQTFAPAEDGGAFITSSDSVMLGKNGVNAGLFFNWSDSPLVGVDSVTGKRTPVVESLSTFDAFVSYGFHPIMQASVAVPYNLAAGASPTGKDISGGAMGDLRVKGKLQILNRDGAPVGLAVLPFVNVPSGKAEAYVGDGSFTGGANLAADMELPPLLVDDRAVVVGANAGLFGRKPVSGGGKVELGSQMSYGVAVNVPLLPVVDFVVDSFGRTLLSEPFGQIAGTPFEVDAGLHLLTFRDKGVRITAGAGKGLTEGVGAPGFRVFAGVIFAMPADKSDRDGDGFLDGDDECPDEPEDSVGYRAGYSFRYFDQDGCPAQRSLPISIRGRTQDGETGVPVTSAAVALVPPVPNIAGAPGYFEFTTKATGVFTLTAEAPGYAPLAQTLATYPGFTTDLTLRMTADKGTVEGTIVDAASGVPLTAVLDVAPGGLRAEAKDGQAVLKLRPGTYAITASAGGYAPASVTVSVAANEIAPLRVALAKTMITVTGRVLDGKTGNPVVADVLLFEKERFQNGQSEAAGTFSFSTSPMTTYTFRLSANGYDTLTTGVTPAGLAELVVKLQPKKIQVAEKKLVLDPIFFETNKDVILPSSYTIVDALADYLKEHADIKLSIEGHTDAKGSAKKNRVLSQRRAEAVRDALVSRGVAAARLTAKGFGPDRPIAPNDSEENRAKNRRVEFIVVGDGTPSP